MTDGAWTAIVLAGERPGGDPFAIALGYAAKGLIPVAGEPMLGRVVKALLASPPVGKIVILSNAPETLASGALGWLGQEPRIAFASAADSISRGIAGAAGSVAPYPVLVVTADHALLTPAMVEAFVPEAGEADAAYAAVERRTVESAFPEARRTWVRFGDGHYTGANLFALLTPAAQRALAGWARMEGNRKRAWRLIRYVGLWTALRVLLGTISIHEMTARAGRKVGLKLKVVKLPFPDAAIDVDKAEDLVLAERILGERSQSAE